jgi:SAM-dependent methyltransferase
MIETVQYKGILYPKFQTKGYAAKYAIPFAQEVCIGKGVDIGCNREDWKFPGAYAVDPILNEYTANDFPFDNLDYIFSSHCLEHLYDWVSILDYWKTKLKPEGVLFMYLPDYSQEYWRPWNNRKHINIFSKDIIVDYLKDRSYTKIFCSGVDLYNAFMVIAQKENI